MKYHLYDIRSSRQNVEKLPECCSLRDKYINDSFVKEMIELPEGDHIVLQISDYISDKAMWKLNEVFQKRPDIFFRVYGCDDANGWNLSFLSMIPSVSRLILNCFWALNTDFSVLCGLDNLKELIFHVFDMKDFSFLNNLTENLEDLHIDAEMLKGKSKFDCRQLLRFQSLHTLYLGHIEKNLDCIVGLSNLKNLTLRGGAKDLSFLKELPIEELEISWCNASKVDWNSLRGLTSLKSLTLFSIKKLEDVSFITELPNLETLKFDWMGAVTRLPDLSGLTKLRVIDFETCNKLTDVSGLVNVRSLEKVRIFGNKLSRETAQVLTYNSSIKELICNGYGFDRTKKIWNCLYR